MSNFIERHLRRADAPEMPISRCQHCDERLTSRALTVTCEKCGTKITFVVKDAKKAPVAQRKEA